MDLDATRLVLAFREPQRLEELAASLSRLGLALEEDETNAGGGSGTAVINHTGRHFWVRDAGGQGVGPRPRAVIFEVFGDPLEWIGPVYRVADAPGRSGLVCPLPSVLLVREERAARVAADPELERFRAREARDRSELLVGYRYYVMDSPNDLPSYELQDHLMTRGSSVDDVPLENMPMIVPLDYQPVDPLFAQQWDMVTIRAGGPGTTGWDRASGSHRADIAILDSGCDLTHPDLYFAGPGYNPGQIAGDGGPNPVLGSYANFPLGHGTCCAGIAAARVNNLKGVCGVAGTGSAGLILPLAFTMFTEGEFALGLSLAVSRGARVVNLSFSTNNWNAQILNPSISYAHANNVVLCASTGNNALDRVSYPASDPRIIACGSSDATDRRVWDSNWGPQISVVAPGDRVPSTDIQGSGGFNPDPQGDYFLTFSGTSAAAPHVSGLASLLMSEKPTLTSEQVRDIIERTADRVRPDVYVYEDRGGVNGTWNNEMGHGRINVLRALEMVRG
ncbi:S8 family serine peptidase [Streptomyces sp. NPDC017993]|uniref:S8 family serine peptidase n=1 Tax=Streptomyces sp. NPDC017993 TaxID=3365027 RepID=UPI0037A44255